MWWNTAPIALVLLFGPSALPQDRPQLPPDAYHSPASARTGASQRPMRTAEPEKTHKKEGSERIFGIFPAFNVSNQGNPEPLTGREKFSLFARSTYDPVTLTTPALKVPFLQTTESKSDLGTGFGAFAKRYGILLADGTSSRFFRQFFFPTILHEDPRYFRKGRGSFGSRLKYSGSRMFVTGLDSGSKRFNWSRLLGSAASAGLSNTYYPESQRGATATMFSFSMSYVSEASSNILKEFAPDIARKLSRKKSKNASGANAGRD